TGFRHQRLRNQMAGGGSAIAESDLLALDVAERIHIGIRVGNDDRAVSRLAVADRKSTRLNSSHLVISYAVFCLKKKKTTNRSRVLQRDHPTERRSADPQQCLRRTLCIHTPY